jgi:hypothetical protein
VPIPLQPWTKQSDDPLAKKALSTILKMVGVNESVSRTKAEQLASEIAQSYMSDRSLTSEEKEHHQLRRHLIDEAEKGNWKPLFDARAKGQVDQREVHQIEHDVAPRAASGSHEPFQILGFYAGLRGSQPGREETIRSHSSAETERATQKRQAD